MNDSRGSLWRKWDLQVQPVKSEWLNRTNEIGVQERIKNSTNSFIEKAVEQNISTIAITDHNCGHAIDYSINNDKGVVVLPGVELDTSEAWHVLIIFNPEYKESLKLDKWSEVVESFLQTRCKIERPFFHENGAIKKIKKQTSQLIEEICKHKIGIPIFAHCRSNDGFFDNSDNVERIEIIKKMLDGEIFFAFEIKDDLTQIDDIKQKVKGWFPKIDYENFPIPILSSSDANKADNVGTSFSWIKADQTFQGLMQIVYEPNERVFIGDEPQILSLIRNNPLKYFNKLEIKPIDGYNGKNGLWFNNTTIEFNNGLCGIIGNKGKGKSAIADVLGLLGNSKVSISDQKDKLFSFLNKDKFCKSGFAENFEAILYWNDGSPSPIKKLSDNIDFSDNEKIKYIPQKFFEDLCSTEDDENFREELNNVVFSRVDKKDKLGKNTFNEFIEYKTELIKNDIENINIKLKGLNSELLSLSNKQSPEYKNSIRNKIKGKEDELNAHLKLKENITTVQNPSEDEKLSKEQKEKSESILKLNEQISSLQEKIDENVNKQELLEIQKHELSRLHDDIQELENYVSMWKMEQNEIFKKYSLDIDKIIKLKTEKQLINIEKDRILNELNKIEKLLSTTSSLDENNQEISIVVKIEHLKKQKEKYEGELEKPFKDYHNYQQKLKEWEIRKTEIEGNIESPNTLAFFKNELNYLENNLEQEIVEKKAARNNFTLEIYRKKKEIQNTYNKIKTSITDLLSEYSSDQKITLETSFEIETDFFKSFFNSYVNRYGDFYQKEDNFLRDFTAKYNLDSEEKVIEFTNDLISKNIHYKENAQLRFLNYLFSLEYLNPRYNLRLNSKSLKELSPGERGGLLLIFYLILDKDDKPLVIDQPEDNLDNQSVSEILVPYIREAKKRRQIVMVTHNPNLAVVSDADQIIRMNIEKENNFEVSHISGAIENPKINKAVVDILEGKMKAFNNRRLKYYTKE